MEPLRLEQREAGDWQVVAAIGQVDVATAPRLRQVLTELQYGGVVRLAIDLDGVEFLDSFGLGVIVGAVRRARAHDGEVALVCSRARLLHLFELAGLDRILRIVVGEGEL
jgi:anti-sigma B factor antagonist